MPLQVDPSPSGAGLIPVKRGRGRPKGSKNRFKSVIGCEGVRVSKLVRGRPKGSKNRDACAKRTFCS